MSDDDYEVVTTMPCGCEHCAKINVKMEKTKQIEGLLKELDVDIPNLKHGVKVEYVLSNIYKTLKIMNGIE